MRPPKALQITVLLAAIGAISYFGLFPYYQYGLAAGVINERDPFRIRHGAKTSIPAEDIHPGAVKDQIPALTNPRFVPAAEAPAWLSDDARVLGVEHNGVAKAYPTLILLWHEAVNDTVGGKPYLVTY